MTDEAIKEEAHGKEALHELVSQAGELGGYMMSYFHTKVDYMGMSIRQIIIGTALGGLAFVTLAALLVVSAALMCIGLADVLGTALERPWLGNLIIGIGLLASIALVFLAVVTHFQTKHLKNKSATYSSEEQRGRYALAQSLSHND